MMTVETNETLAQRAERLAGWLESFHDVPRPEELEAASVLRDLAAANAQLERERDEWKSTAEHWASQAQQLHVKSDAANAALEAVRHDEARQIERAVQRQGEIDAANAAREAAEGERDRAFEALKPFASKMMDSIQKDLRTAHQSRGNGASEWMLEDDRDLRTDLRKAIKVARAALTPAPEAPTDGE